MANRSVGLSGSGGAAWACTLIVSAGLVACGGGGGPSTAQNTSTATLSGTVATGAALANATVLVTDATGKTATSTTASDGTFNVDVTGLSGPVIVSATDPTGTIAPLVSVSATLPSAGARSTVNVTPLTTGIAALLTSSGNPYAITPANVATLVTPGTVAHAVEVLDSALHDALDSNGLPVSGFNPLTAPLVANNVGADALNGAVNVLSKGTGGLQLVSTADPSQSLALNDRTTAPSTPLPAPPVASNAVDFLQAEIQKCLAVDLTHRGSDATCNGTLDTHFLHNGQTSVAAVVPLLGLNTSVGAKIGLPRILWFQTNGAGNQLAIVSFPITLTDGTQGSWTTALRKVPAGTSPTTFPDGTVATWTIYGNQSVYSASVTSRAIRTTHLDTLSVNGYRTGLNIEFNPSTASASGVNAVNVTGPGLPGTGVWLFRSTVCGTANYMTIEAAARTSVPTSAVTIGSNTPVYVWDWAAQDPNTTFTPLLNATRAASQVDTSTIPFAATYTFKLYDTSGALITSFTRRNDTPAVGAGYAAQAAWPTLSPATTAAFLSPTGSLAGAQTSFTVNWTNAAHGLPVNRVFAVGTITGTGGGTAQTPVDGYGYTRGVANSALVSVGSSSGTSGSCGGTQIPALLTGTVREIELGAFDMSGVQLADQTRFDN